MLEHGMVMYDALYARCQNCRAERIGGHQDAGVTA